MYRWTSRLPLSLLVLLSIGGATRADLITAPWTYTWSAPTSVAATNDPSGGITMTLSPLAAGTTLTGSSDINAVRLTTFSTASANSPDVFNDAKYSLTINLKDITSGATGQLIFQGEFGPSSTQTSVLSTTNVNIQNTFLSPSTQTVKLGNYDYTVSLNTYVPPGLPGSITSGSIGADVTIAPATSGGGGGTGVQDVPEPSTLLLTSLAVPAGLAWWRTRALRRREETND